MEHKVSRVRSHTCFQFLERTQSLRSSCYTAENVQPEVMLLLLAGQQMLETL